jgi:hypothetical protein
MKRINILISMACFAALSLPSILPCVHAESMVWFGNSYSDAGTIYRNIPAMINCNCGVTENLTIDSLCPKIYPSCWLGCHETMWPAFTVIDSGHYNLVVAQNNVADWVVQSYSSEGPTDANQLTTWADHAKGAGGVLVIEQIWLSTTNTFAQSAQDKADFWYDSVARATNSIMAPCGHAWWIARQARPNLEYIAPNWSDGHHPGTFSAYLNQCVFFATLTGVSPVGLNYKKTTFGSDITLPDSDALFAQQKAWEAYLYFHQPTNLAITNFTANPPASLFGVQTSVTFSATVTDDKPLSGVVIDLSTIGGPRSVAMTASGNTYSYTYSVPATVPLGIKTVSVRATDNTNTYQIARLIFDVERPLKLNDVRSAYDNTKVDVVFSEKVDKTTSETVANYSINKGVTISAAADGPDSNIVVLTTSGLTKDITYTLTVNNVKDDAGSVIPSAAQDTFQFFVGGNGVTGTYWQNENLSGTPVGTQVDSSIYFLSGFNCPQLLYTDWIGIRWDGMLQIPYTGTYTFYGHVDRAMRMYLNNQLVVDGWAHTDTLYTGSVFLNKGTYPFKMEYSGTQGQKFCQLRWSSNTKIGPMQTIPKLFFFTTGTTSLSPVPPLAAAGKSSVHPVYSVKSLDLRGRVVSTSETVAPEKNIVPRTGLYFLEVTDAAKHVSVKRVCSLK